MSETPIIPPDAEPGFETSDAPPKLFAYGAAGLTLLVLFVLAALRVGFSDAAGDRDAGPQRPLPPQPRLQTDAHADLATMLAADRVRLSGYGWIDRDRDSVHIPIDEAVTRLIVESKPGDMQGSSR